MKPTTPLAAETHRAAFTLLEILAVVAIFALVASVAMPNFSGLQARNLDDQARRMVAKLELARQRAIVTGVPHRLHIDIDASAYRVEWLGSAEGDATGDAGAEEAEEFEDYGQPLDLTAPRDAEPSFVPIAGSFGRFQLLDESTIFAGVETTGGWVEGGESFVRFEQDGSADATTIVIEHEAGLAVALEILPLASHVRITHETL